MLPPPPPTHTPSHPRSSGPSLSRPPLLIRGARPACWRRYAQTVRSSPRHDEYYQRAVRHVEFEMTRLRWRALRPPRPPCLPCPLWFKPTARPCRHPAHLATGPRHLPVLLACL